MRCRRSMASNHWDLRTARLRSTIFGDNNARLYNFTPQQRSALENDRFAQLKKDYLKKGADRSNLTYGYIRKPKA